MSCGGSKHENANAEAISDAVKDVNERVVSQREWGPLFHGTQQEFKPGDVITPRSKKVAHAAQDLGTARIFSKRDGVPGRVYEVEPVGPFTDNDVWSQTMRHSDGRREVVSNKGFRVIAEVPKSRREAYYDAARDEAAKHNAALGYAYCSTCKDTHLPDDHIE